MIVKKYLIKALNDPYLLERVLSFLSAILLIRLVQDQLKKTLSLQMIFQEFPFFQAEVLPKEFYVGFYFLLISAFIVVGFFPRRGVYLLPLCWLCAISLRYSFGKMNHDLHGFYYVSLALCLSQFLKSSIKAKDNLIFTFVTFMYLQASLHKMRFLFYFDSPWEVIKSIFPIQLAFSTLEGSHQNISLIEFFINHPQLSALMWVLAIVLQFSLVWCIFLSYQWKILALFAALVMHRMNAILLGVSFTSQQWLLLALIVYYGFMRGLRYHNSSQPTF